MSQLQINLNPDLKKLRDEGFEVHVTSNHLIIRNVPYVNSQKEVKFGSLISELSRKADGSPRGQHSGN